MGGHDDSLDEEIAADFAGLVLPGPSRRMRTDSSRRPTELTSQGSRGAPARAQKAWTEH